MKPADTISFEKLSKMEGFMIDLSLKVERAGCILSDLTENYFSTRPEDLKENLWQIQHEYADYSTRADIIGDYICSIKKAIEAANKFINDEYEKVRESKFDHKMVESEVAGSMVPLIDLPQISDERWHELAAESKRNHPEVYEKYERGELV
ncbi:hypothetical protein [Acetobacterium tundrae]|uniref:Uncharacterized protein n=1 Tax=Acetobacterium tundrae TaxID=132932 RepID=A0ABR6WKX4_9FIRM|nr:hypothetical protein [Acetobacterium tundrae]MBC3797160.1 hypothetical protein [Acetobacterium tundrae]